MSKDLMDIFISSNKQKEEIKEEKIKKNTLWDYINQINKKNNVLKFDSKICSSYMLMLHYSNSTRFLKITERMNKYLFSIDSEYVYKYFYDQIPKGNHFIKWPKKTKEDKKKEKLIDEYCEKYNMSRKEAQEYL